MPAPDLTPTCVSRRAFLGQTAAALGLTGLLAACGGGGGEQPTPPDAPTGGGDALQASSCPGYDTVEDSARQLRSSLNYVDVSVVEGQNCTNCRFYNAPAEMAPCGGCQLFGGPVAPAGHCTSWAEAVQAAS